MENQTQQVQPQPEQKKKWYKKWWGIVTIMIFSLFVLIIIIPADSENEEVGKNEKKQEEQATTTNQLTQNQENKTEEAKKEDIIKLKITQPEGESIEVTQDTFSIEGSVASSDIIIEINKENSNKNEVINVGLDGSFGLVVDLQKGSNAFEIIAKKDEKEVKKSLVILRKMTIEEMDTELKAEAETIPYKDLFRNIDKHKEEKIHYTGEVIQVIGDGKFLSTMRVDITKGAYGIWDDTVLVTNLDFDADKILEDDIIEFWGIVMGEESYETVMGATVSLPSMSASIIELVK